MFSNRVNLTLKALLVQTVKGGGPEVEEVFFSDFSPHLPGVFFEHGVIIKASFCLIHIVKYDKILYSLVCREHFESCQFKLIMMKQHSKPQDNGHWIFLLCYKI